MTCQRYAQDMGCDVGTDMGADAYPAVDPAAAALSPAVRSYSQLSARSVEARTPGSHDGGSMYDIRWPLSRNCAHASSSTAADPDEALATRHAFSRLA